MEYIPDGLTKEQWAAMKKKEEEKLKDKDLGKVGITKFKSRSFEAWQKGGQKHLFPVDPNNVKFEERPYMQRTGGSADGEDLKKKGLQGFGQALFAKKTDVDAKYEKLEKEGKLKSTTFNTPWTAAEAAKLEKERREATKAARKGAAVKGTAAVKGKKTASAAEAKTEVAPPKKKGLFGLF